MRISLSGMQEKIKTLPKGKTRQDNEKSTSTLSQQMFANNIQKVKSRRTIIVIVHNNISKVFERSVKYISFILFNEL